MAITIRNQSLPARVLAATGYERLPGAQNISRAGTKRARRWPIIEKYDRHPDGIALAYRQEGVTKRHFYMLERRGQLKSFGPEQLEPRKQT